MNDERIAKVEHVCAELAAAGEPITFVSISTRSGLPRSTLYQSPALRAIVEEHRAHAREAHTLSGLAGEVANLRLGLEALADRVRHHEEQLRLLVRTKKRTG